MLKKWIKISEETIYSNNWWEYRKDLFEIPGINKGEYHYVYSRGSSMVIPLFDDGKILFVNQYRYLNDMFSIELPCGGVQKGYNYEQTALKELEEETGYTSKNIEFIGEFNPFNGVTNEYCRVYLAENLEKCISKPDLTEEFEIITLSLEEIYNYIIQNKIWDGMTLASLLLYEKKRGGK